MYALHTTYVQNSCLEKKYLLSVNRIPGAPVNEVLDSGILLRVRVCPGAERMEDDQAVVVRGKKSKAR